MNKAILFRNFKNHSLHTNISEVFLNPFIWQILPSFLSDLLENVCHVDMQSLNLLDRCETKALQALLVMLWLCWGLSLSLVGLYSFDSLYVLHQIYFNTYISFLRAHFTSFFFERLNQKRHWHCRNKQLRRYSTKEVPPLKGPVVVKRGKGDCPQETGTSGHLTLKLNSSLTISLTHLYRLLSYTGNVHSNFSAHCELQILISWLEDFLHHLTLSFQAWLPLSLAEMKFFHSWRLSMKCGHYLGWSTRKCSLPRNTRSFRLTATH